MHAWKTSPWSIRIGVLLMLTYVIVAPTLILSGYFGPNVRDGFLLAMGIGKGCR